MLYEGLTATHELEDLIPFTKHALIELGMEDGSDELRQHLHDALRSLGATNVASRELPILKGRLQQLVEREKVLLVIDNVCDAAQLDALLPSNFAEGSLVVITSRSKELPASSTFVKVGRHGR